MNQLHWLSRHHSKLYRRIVRSADVFIESYYNTNSVDMNARILLQAAAFETLLDLPELAARKEFKTLVETNCAEPNERRYRYSFEVPGGRKTEAWTLKGIWADRFFTLRNHIIHGEVVRRSEFNFRGQQHHFVIAPSVFVLLVKKLIDEARRVSGKPRSFYDRLLWKRWKADEDIDGSAEVQGFQLETDFAALFLARDVAR